MELNVSVSLANITWGAAANKLAWMFYSLLTPPNFADIIVHTQWHVWGIPLKTKQDTSIHHHAG